LEAASESKLPFESMNAISIIAPYKCLGMWVFDEPRVGLVQEPFVAGADTMIDRVVENIPEAEEGFLMLFSATPFPGHQVKLEWRRADESAAIGITRPNSIWKVGSARRCSSISPRRRMRFMCK
jgi:hypothetical protein